MTADKSSKSHAPTASGSNQSKHLQAYALFLAEVKEEALQEYEQKNKGRAEEGKPDLKRPNVSQLASRKWKKLDESQKQAYQNRV